ncbi:hypothetical protein B0T22DRAFT_528658 [Podospora appendiculata]|uniref:C2H2-type domain-containing protein n=1 Tax=Podospora appendiculata TaxID=314037 RepID=A0AAE0XC67_9PEZI|nr:hypothetical protein B0T22DRAFT_528658 [Podospora appendiculata]
MMHPPTLQGAAHLELHLVNGLTSAFEAGLDFYMKWKQKLESQNHYQGRKEKASSATASKCAVSTSLEISSHRIRAAYQVGFAIIGAEFSSGDAECRQALTTNLAQLEERVASLRAAFCSKQRQFINLNEVYLASEAIRTRCVTALAEQYRRCASGRAVPQEMPIARPRTAGRQDEQVMPPIKVLPARVEFDRQTAVWSTNSDPPTFKSEPPSPPLTPKHLADDTESCFSPPSEVGQPSGRQPLRPKNSVFSIFCSEAMALQVDPSRPIPTASRHKCRCGYKWKVPELSESKDYIAVKDGFRMTRRFLAKSHCDQSTDEGVAIGSSADQPRPGYGCVLCTSTGRSETYETAENLRVHINATHDKWQMLHDRDMTK